LKLPVYKLADEMPYEELLGWMSYFEMRPIEWRHDDRTAKLLQAQGVKEKATNLFPSLKAIYNPVSPIKLKSGTIDPKSFKQSALFSKMLSAKDGDKLNIWDESK
jgi:hypothetical protein